MSIIYIMIVLIIIGFVMWLINAIIPMAKPIKLMLNIVVTVAVLVWVLTAFGISIPGIQL